MENNILKDKKILIIEDELAIAKIMKRFIENNEAVVQVAYKGEIGIKIIDEFKPDILILDEPTSGLDGKNMQIIAHTLKQIAASGTCVIVITHDLELIADSCDFILDLNSNKKENK